MSLTSGFTSDFKPATDSTTAGGGEASALTSEIVLRETSERNWSLEEAGAPALLSSSFFSDFLSSRFFHFFVGDFVGDFPALMACSMAACWLVGAAGSSAFLGVGLTFFFGLFVLSSTPFRAYSYFFAFLTGLLWNLVPRSGQIAFQAESN